MTATTEAPDRIRQLSQHDASLAVGMEVTAFWGYGSGFVARGRGRIVKVFPKSVRVELTEDVDYRGEVGWSKGFILQGIPKFPSPQWNEWHRVAKVEPYLCLTGEMEKSVANAMAEAGL